MQKEGGIFLCFVVAYPNDIVLKIEKFIKASGAVSYVT